MHSALEPLEPILECLSDGVLVADAGGTIVRANAAAARILGAPALALPRPWTDFAARLGLHADDAAAALPLANDASVPASRECALGAPPDVRFIRLSVSPVRAGGAIAGVVILLADVTDSVTGRNVRARESEALHRLELLTEFGVALSGATSRDEVARVVVDRGTRAAAADICTLHVFDASEETLVLIGARGVAPEVVEHIQRMRAATGNPRMFAAARSGEALWAETFAEYEGLFPAIATLPATGPRARAFWAMPLVVEARPIGLLAMGFYRERRFSPEERRWIDGFARHSAQALARAERMERERETRSWLSTTLRSIGDAVITTDTEGRVTFMNPVAERLTGFGDDEARGRPLADVFPIVSEKTGEPAESPVARVLREGVVVGLANHTVLRSRSGAAIPIDDSGSPIRDANGTLFGVVLVFRDVSADKRRERQGEVLARAGDALASSLDYRTTLANVARLAVPELADWCVVDVLEPGKSTLQQIAVAHVDPERVALAQRLADRYRPDPEATRGAPQVSRTGNPELYPELPPALLEARAHDAEHLRLLHELRLESAMIVPLQGRGRILGAMTFVYAGSGRRYSEDDLAFAVDFARRAAMAIENAIALEEATAARQEAQLASVAKDEFLATVSPELRTPLNAILGWAVTLLRRTLPEEVARPLAIIERNAQAQKRLIEDILDVSRIISGKLALTIATIPVGEVVQRAVDSVRPAADAKGLALEVTIEDPALLVHADAARLQQVVWNLLSNAVKFTPRGGSVSARALRQGSDVRIVVHDDGEGIPAEALPHVFEPFRQADSTTTRRHGGLGLGLAIVRRLVNAHGGTVDAQSEGPGRGAMFTVNLPARAAVAPIQQAAPIAPGAEAAREILAGQPRLDGLKVLVVDDEEGVRELLTAALSELGAEVHAAASAAEALERLALARPDVVISDIGMPIVDGHALIRQLRALPVEAGGRTPAIALTAYARAEDARRALAAGYQRHVAKPVDPAELAAVMKDLAPRRVE
jgi:PAS domain S-box-containing protein